MAKSTETIHRITVAVVMLPLLIFSFFSDVYDHGIILLSLIILFSIGSSLEMLSFLKAKNIKTYPYIVLPAAGLINLVTYLALKFNLNVFMLSLSVFILGVLIIFILHVISGKIEDTLNIISSNAFAILYPGFLLSFILLAKYEFGYWYLPFLFLISLGTDGAAYFVGIFLGKHKLNLPASPNKSLEGYIGGLAITLLIILLLTQLIAPQYFTGIIFDNVILEIFLVIFLIIIGYIGDLLESSIKRDVGKKDSAYKLFQIAGHGGLMDIIDSTLLVFPFSYFIIKLIALL